MKIPEYLIANGVKPSVQRIAIMDYLLANKTHPTAEEIYAALVPDMPTLSKTTVYNTLKLFADKGAALCINIDERTTRFDGDTSEHAHFICLGCGCIYDLRVENLKYLMLKDADELKITETHLYFKGYCKTCKEKLKKEK